MSWKKHIGCTSILALFWGTFSGHIGFSPYMNLFGLLIIIIGSSLMFLEKKDFME